VVITCLKEQFRHSIRKMTKYYSLGGLACHMVFSKYILLESSTVQEIEILFAQSVFSLFLIFF